MAVAAVPGVDKAEVGEGMADKEDMVDREDMLEVLEAEEVKEQCLDLHIRVMEDQELLRAGVRVPQARRVEV